MEIAGEFGTKTEFINLNKLYRLKILFLKNIYLTRRKGEKNE